MEIFNDKKLSKDFIWQDSIGLTTKTLGSAANSEKIYVNIDYVPPTLWR